MTRTPPRDNEFPQQRFPQPRARTLLRLANARHNTMTPQQQTQSGAVANAAPGMTGGLSEQRVIRYTARHFGIPRKNVRLQALTPDASTRKYYRVAAAAEPTQTHIISLYPSPFNPHDNSFLDVTNLFEHAGLPVPRIIDVAGTEGIILQEDLGDCSLARAVNDARARGDKTGAARLLHEAIELIVRIQAATPLACSLNSVASRLAFDEDKLSWELNYFFDHFFGSYRGVEFADGEAEAIRRDLRAIAEELAAQPRVLTHRDYHGMNLMVDSHGDLKIIDHQDARMGPATYDLVPLLVERRLEPADETWVEAQQLTYLRLRAERDLPPIDLADLRAEFHLMTVQRQLKAVGTFSYQTAVVGRGEVYEQYISPAVATVLRAMQKPGMPPCPALRTALESLS
jgi:N-acetylmuramate 1-kinase